MTRSKRLIILSLVVIVLLAIILTLTAGDLLKSAIINPIVYFMLIFKEFVAALPDLPIWLGFVFLSALAVVLTVIDLFKATPKPPQEQTFVNRGGVSELAERVKLSAQGEFFKWRLTRQLSDLAVDLVAMKRKLDHKGARQAFEAGAWTQEPGIKEFLKTEPLIRPYTALERLLRYLKPRRRGDKRYQAELARVVSFLEAYAREAL